MEARPEIDLDHLCRLARLSLTEGERERLRDQLGRIVSYVEKLKEVDVDGVEPMAHAMPLTNVWREDVATPHPDPDGLLRNAPETRDHQIVVPKVID